MFKRQQKTEQNKTVHDAIKDKAALMMDEDESSEYVLEVYESGPIFSVPYQWYVIDTTKKVARYTEPDEYHSVGQPKSHQDAVIASHFSFTKEEAITDAKERIAVLRKQSDGCLVSRIPI